MSKTDQQPSLLDVFSKIRIYSAARILSRIAADALDCCLYGDVVRDTLSFVRIMNKCFDIIDVKQLYEWRNSRNPD